MANEQQRGMDNIGAGDNLNEEIESLCDSDGDNVIYSGNWRGWKQTKTSFDNYRGGMKKTYKSLKGESLMELCSRIVAETTPFEKVEQFITTIPENVLLRIAYWSFPKHEDAIRLYSIIANGSPDEFVKGENLLKHNTVMNVLQIGFHLSAVVIPIIHNRSKHPGYKVAISFDRCKITSCSCDCNSGAGWCSHIIAVCLHRIHKPDSTKLRAPVSESLSRLSKTQLQKFSQYLISELPQHILPTAQRLLDDLLTSFHTEINKVQGAPDPTAGPSIQDQCIWYLDDAALIDKVKKTLIKFCGPSPVVYSDVQYMSNTEPNAVAEYSSLLRPLRAKEPEGIWNLLSIVREMLKRQDSNAVTLLDIISTNCLEYNQIAMWWYYTKTSSSYLDPSMATQPLQLNQQDQRGRNDRFQQHNNYQQNNHNSEIAQYAASSMLDELVSLWRLIVLDPTQDKRWRLQQKRRLKKLHTKTFATVRTGRYREQNLHLFEAFQPAIKACEYEFLPQQLTMCRHILASPSRNNTSIYKGSTTQHNKKNDQPGGAFLFNDDLPDKLDELKLADKDEQGDTIKDQESTTTDNGPTTSGLCTNKLTFKVVDTSRPNVPRRQKLKHTSKFGYESEYREELDMLFTRTETLYAHGRTSEACELAVKLADEILEKPNDFSYKVDSTKNQIADKREWLRITTPQVEKALEYIHLLCNVLQHYSRYSSLAFMVGLQGLELKRPPAFSKALEVKLLHKQTEISQLMKKLPLGETEIIRLSEKAMELAAMDSTVEMDFVFPILLADFMWDKFCLKPRRRPTTDNSNSNAGSNQEQNDNVEESSQSTSQQQQDSSSQQQSSQHQISPLMQSIIDESRPLVEEATLNVLRFKMNVSELDHPLLCEGIRRQKGDLVLKMLDQSQDDPDMLKRVLKSLLDKTMCPNLRSTSSFPTNNNTSGTNDKSTKEQSQQNLQQHNLSVSNQSYTEGQQPPTADSSDDESKIRNTVASPSRRDSSKNWRSPTVRAKRKLHCVVTVNSSASEEAMLSDTNNSPRLRRRTNLNGHHHHHNHHHNHQHIDDQPSTSTNPLRHQQVSPSSDSSSTDSATSRGKRKRDNNTTIMTSQSPSKQQQQPLTSSAHINGGNMMQNGGGRNYNNRRGNYRGRNCLIVPDQPNQPSEAAAYFYFELAKNVLVKAGGNNTTSLFTHNQQRDQENSVNRNLVLAAFEIGLYALGLSNCVTPNWVSRTYSSHVSWITGQAMEIGGAAIEILIESWEGHLTAPEISTLADRASHGRDEATVKKAAQLALTTLPFAASLNLNEIHRALNQCKEQGPKMLEAACHAVEEAGKSGGVFPEVLFDVAQMWEFVHQQKRKMKSQPSPTTTTSTQSTKEDQTKSPATKLKDVKSNEVVQYTKSSPLSNGSSNPPSTPQPPTVAFPPPPIHAAIPQQNGVSPPRLQNIPVTVGGMIYPQIFQMQPNIMVPPPPLMVPPPTPATTGGPPHIATGFQLDNFPTHHVRYTTALHVQANGNGGVNLVPVPIPTIMQGFRPPSAVATHPHPATFLSPATPADVVRHHTTSQQRNPQLHPPPLLPMPTLPKQEPVAKELAKAFKVGMLALELLAKKPEDRPTNKYVRNPAYSNSVKWVLNLSKKLGPAYVQQFCGTVIQGVSSPFVLYDIAREAAQFFTEKNGHSIHVNFNLPFVRTIASRCQQTFIQNINNKLYHLHNSSEYDDFIQLVKTARNAFMMLPTGHHQFNELLTTINRSKNCKKDLWQKLNTALST